MKPTLIAFCSSPRRKSNSEILADAILTGAQAAGAQVEKVRLSGLTIHPCTACGACQKSVEAPCVLKDDMAALLAKVRRADGLVFASPIYFATVNAQMKAFLDRWYALFGGGRFDALKGKRMALAFAYGDSDPLASGAMNAVRMFQDASHAMQMKLAGWVHASCLAAGEVKKNRAALDAATALGRKLLGD